ncbi:type VI secretion system baseplate subunit TssG [soil metagenome]
MNAPDTRLAGVAAPESSSAEPPEPTGLRAPEVSSDARSLNALALNALWTALEREPWKHDFRMALRRVETLFPHLPRLGTAARPSDEPLRLGHTPAMDFAPAALSAFTPGTQGRPPRLDVRFFGLFGPNGPMPLHLTDYARERLLARDPTLARFADMFHHRLLLLFYRAWSQAQPAVSLDRPAQDRFATYVGSLIGYGSPALTRREEVPDHVRLHFAGLFAQRTRNADGLAAILGGYFRQPVRIETFVGHWMELPGSERTRLDQQPGPSQQLGMGVVLGRRVWDRQHKFRIEIGPLTLERFESFLPLEKPAGKPLRGLVALVRDYLSQQLEWDLRLVLQPAEVPRTRLGANQRLGWTSWLGARSRRADAPALTLDAERLLSRQKLSRPPRDADGAATRPFTWSTA